MRNPGTRIMISTGLERMTQQELSQAKVLRLRASHDAMNRTAAQARQVTIQIDAALVLIPDGEMVRIRGEALREGPN